MTRIARHTLIAAACFAALACTTADQGGSNSAPPSPTPPVIYATAKVNDVALTLSNENGRCLLSYASEPPINPAGAGGNTVLLDMEAPCNFVCVYGRPDEPQVYSFRNDGRLNRKIVLVVGGKPDPSQGLQGSDQFMPQGCGTWMQKAIVHRSSISVDFPALQPGGHLCPSHGMDEVFFAA